MLGNHKRLFRTILTRLSLWGTDDKCTRSMWWVISHKHADMSYLMHTITHSELSHMTSPVHPVIQTPWVISGIYCSQWVISHNQPNTTEHSPPWVISCAYLLTVSYLTCLSPYGSSDTLWVTSWISHSQWVISHISSHLTVSYLTHIITPYSDLLHTYHHTLQWVISHISSHLTVSHLTHIITLYSELSHTYHHTLQWVISHISSHLTVS
jgi:hypothetical protein